MPPPPPLPDELIEEIFLRLPPDEPAWIVRCSLASQPWHGLLTGPRFRGRYREFHGTPPVLGFFKTRSSDSGTPFVPAESAGGFFTSRTDLAATKVDYTVWDCRHGRVLLCNGDQLVAWDPMTGSQGMLESPDDFCSRGAVVFCNVTGCDHNACHEGPFQVFFVGVHNYNNGNCDVEAYEYSPKMAKCESSLEMAQWSDYAELELDREEAFLVAMPPVFVQDDALYFMLIYGEASNAILKYDLADSHDGLSVFDVPPSVQTGDATLVAMQDGALGFAHLDGLTLNLWSRKMGSDEVTTWTQRTSIDLQTLIPIRNPNERLGLKGSVEGTYVIFFTTHLGIYEINLKSLRWKKILKRKEEDFRLLIPYMSF